MKFRIGLLLAAAGLAAAVVEAGAQAPAGARPARSVTKADVERALPLTCVQAWTASGRQYPQMLATVIMLAKVSLANRNLTFPNTREAGEDAGKGIADDCKADPDALLFAIVDKHVRRVARAAP